MRFGYPRILLFLAFGLWLGSSVAQAQSGATLTVNGRSTAITVVPSATVTVGVQNGPGNPTDWLGLYASGAADTAYSTRFYLNGSSKKPPSTGLTTASVPLVMPSSAGFYEFRLFANNGFTKLATSPAVTVGAGAPPPTVTAIAPPQGTVGSSLPVTITGTNFQSGATLSVGKSVTVSTVLVLSPTQLTATLAIATKATLGSRTVTVTNPGGLSGTLTSGFTVVAAAAPTVTAINPNQGAVGATVPVTLTGANFQTGATLSVGTGITVSNVAVPSTTSLTATLAIASTATLGSRTVTVTNPGGLSGTLPASFSIVAAPSPPTVTVITPTQGTVGSSVPIMLTGTNFQSGTTLSVGKDVTVSSVAVPSATQLTATLVIAAGATLGARDVIVTNPGGLSGTLAAGFSVTAAVGPRDISYVYDRLSRLIAVIDPASDTAVYHYDAVGNLLSITRQSTASLAIIAFSPPSGPIGATVTIAGTGFSSTLSENTVTFNGIPAAVTSNSPLKLVVQVPSGATTGPIRVVTPIGSATTASSFSVTP